MRPAPSPKPPQAERSRAAEETPRRAAKPGAPPGPGLAAQRGAPAAPDGLRPQAVVAQQAPLRGKPSNYPAPFASRVAGREKRPLGDLFGLTHFGVNLTSLPPGGVSALRHGHSRQDEFVYVLQGWLVLVTDAGETQLGPGMCAGFPAGSGDAHQLVNRSAEPATYLEVGDRTEGDAVHYPDDDLEAHWADGAWRFRHKDGSPY